MKIPLGLSALVSLVPLVAAPAATHAKPARPACDLGWYVVDGGEALLEGSGATAGSATALRDAHTTGTSSHGRVVSLGGGRVAIEGICAGAPANVRRKGRRTKVRAAWDACSGVEGPVKLRATIDASDCATMRGTVIAKKARPKRQRFRATRTLGDPLDCTSDDTFVVLEKQIFGPKGCRVSACHGEAKSGGLDLRYGAAHLSLVNQAATAAPGKMRVVPGDPEASFLWQKLTGQLGAGEGAQMPASGAPPLDALELALVRSWIEAGAPATGRIDDAPCLPHPTFEPVAPPDPPAGGYQLHFVGPVLEPGHEVEGCVWVRAPNEQDFAVGAWEYVINPGSHHLALWEHDHGPDPALDVFKKDIACFLGGAPNDGRTLTGSPEAPYFVDGYPAGIGRVIRGGQLLGINPHYFNEFDVPIQVEGWINMHPVAGGLQHPVETLFSGAGTLDGKSVYTGIFVEPFSTGSLRLRMVNTLGVPMKIVQMSSHQHQRGTHVTAWNSGGAKIFENFDWAHPAVLTFDDPYVLAPNDYVDYQCEWDNGVTRPVRRCGDAASDSGCTPGDPRAVTFGVTAQDEMCFLTGFYYTD